jgi:hypothetical protein
MPASPWQVLPLSRREQLQLPLSEALLGGVPEPDWAAPREQVRPRPGCAAYPLCDVLCWPHCVVLRAFSFMARVCCSPPRCGQHVCDVTAPRCHADGGRAKQCAACAGLGGRRGRRRLGRAADGRLRWAQVGGDAHTRLWASGYICMYMYICIYVCICIYIGMYIHIYMYVYVYVDLYMYVCVCICGAACMTAAAPPASRSQTGDGRAAAMLSQPVIAIMLHNSRMKYILCYCSMPCTAAWRRSSRR